MERKIITSAEHFLSQLREEIANGKGIVPLLGAGLSATAGIPTRPELMLYLRLCVGMALGLDRFREPRRSPWRPESGWWPIMQGDWRQRAEEATEVLKQIVTNTPGFAKESNEKMHRFVELCQEAYGSLADWRLALQFLARLNLTEYNSHLPVTPRKGLAVSGGLVTAPTASKFKHLIRNHADWAYRITLGDIDEHVVDSFFQHMVSGKMPSMGHNMLVNLVQCLRVRVLLSLNFDELLEQAFLQQRSPLSVVDVHYEAGLPPWSLLSQQVTLVKLHGGRYGLRADFSLDKAPTERDRMCFRSYLLGKNVEDEIGATRQTTSPKDTARYHLLVAGVSGQDRRVRVLVYDALSRIANLKVFWCCYSDQDERELEEHFHDFAHRVIGVRHVQLGLLFSEIYQAVTYCLPPRGLDFPASWQMPAPPSLMPDERGQIMRLVQRPLERAIDWLNSSGHSPGLIIESDPALHEMKQESRSLSGVSALGWELFKLWNGPRRCIWLDCEDVEGPLSLKDYLLQAMAYRVGMDVNKPAIASYLEDADDDLVLHEMSSLLQTSARPWVLFVNLRGSPGYCANSFFRLAMPERPAEMSLSRWIKLRRKQWEWEEDEKASVSKFLNRLAEILRGQVEIIILRDKHTYRLNSTLYQTTIPVPPAKYAGFRNWAFSKAQSAMRWATEGTSVEDKSRRIRLLRAITLFQQVRHHTALVSRSVLRLRSEPAQWKSAWRETQASIQKLLDLRVLRHKAGGFLWMHWEIREHLRELLINNGGVESTIDGLGSLHLGLADWHMTFFHATSDPRAVFQAVYHRCWVAKIGLQSDRSERGLVAARGALCEASNHMELARAQILALGHHYDTRTCFSEYVKFLVRISKTELQRFRKENGESKKASERNLRFLHMVKVKAQLYRIAFERDIGRSDHVVEGCKEIRKWFRRWKQIDAAPLPSMQRTTLYDWYLHSWQEEAFWNANLVDLEWAVVSVSLRDYDAALDRLKAKAHEFHFPLDELLRANRDSEVWNLVDGWIASAGGHGATHDRFRYAIRRFMFHVLRRYMEVLLLKAELNHVQREFEIAGDERLQPLLHQAQMVYLAAQMLPRYVTEQENSLLRVEHSRMHSVMAGILALGGDSDAVYRQINEAYVALASLPDSEDSIARAVLDLRLVYCKFAELRKFESIKQLHEQRLADFKGVTVLDLGEDREKIEALLEEIEVALNRVETRLVSYRKSLWWWMTMCRYRMRWIEYRILLTGIAMEQVPQSTASGLSLERLWATAERLIKDVCMRTTFDSLQMSRVLATFVQVARLKFRFSGVSDTGIISTALARLEQVERDHATVCKAGGVRVAAWLQVFVEKVRQRASTALEEQRRRQ